MKYWRALKTALWGIAGLIISLSFLALDNPILQGIFGYGLFALSLLMFILAAFQFYKDNKKKSRKR